MHRRTLLSVALSLPLLSACSSAESESAVGGTTDLVLATLFVNASAEYDAACRTVYAAANNRYGAGDETDGNTKYEVRAEEEGPVACGLLAPVRQRAAMEPS